MNHFFGQNLKTIRIENRLSQAELGKQMNKGQKTIGNWETGYSEPCLEDLIRISHIFSISLDQLLKEEMKRNSCKAKAGRNRHRDAVVGEPFSPSFNDLKSNLQDTPEVAGKTGDKEIAWRDKYITVLETRLSETTNSMVSEETLKTLMTRILSLQKMIAGITEEGKM